MVLSFKEGKNAKNGPFSEPTAKTSYHLYVVTDFSEEPVASIFRAEKTSYVLPHGSPTYGLCSLLLKDGGTKFF
jgi:hypothetical protein